ncbi:MAG: hypothetical protein EG828_05720 [Deltaproteobacteria bacterium]|nr:hypothetical protein [Deltaproteobacteria bacterium]
MNTLLLVLVAILMAGTAGAATPLFAAKCTKGLNVDSNKKGQVYINGKLAKIIKRPDGQITARSGGVWIDITPKGDQPPLVTYTAKDKTTGVCEVVSFKAPGSSAKKTQASSSERAGQGKYDATGPIPCARYKGQPMGQCTFGVARDGGGTATVVVTHPDGRKRFIFFEKGKAVGADLSQADGNMNFRVRKEADLYLINAGDERYEIPEAVIFGG